MEKVRLGGTKFGNLLIASSINRQRTKMSSQNQPFSAFNTKNRPFSAFSLILTSTLVFVDNNELLQCLEKVVHR